MNGWVIKTGKKELEIRERNGVMYLAFPALDETGLVCHAFSTRIGGVSEGHFATMNFTFTRGDNPAHVLENYHRMAELLGVRKENMVLSYQTHTVNIRRVTEEDAGKGVVRERDYRDVDGLITDVPGITLVTFFADCVPIYFVDTKKRAIGLSHSGWRGTVKRMGRETLNAMRHAYGTVPKDVIACIGPSICQDCFEVGTDVAEAFFRAFDEKWHKELLYHKENGKYQLDLWRANQIILQEAGVPPQQIHTTNICTRCNPDYLFSHRSMGDKRGNLSAFLCLK